MFLSISFTKSKTFSYKYRSLHSLLDFRSNTTNHSEPKHSYIHVQGCSRNNHHRFSANSDQNSQKYIHTEQTSWILNHAPLRHQSISLVYRPYGMYLILLFVLKVDVDRTTSSVVAVSIPTPTIAASTTMQFHSL